MLFTLVNMFQVSPFCVQSCQVSHVFTELYPVFLSQCYPGACKHRRLRRQSWEGAGHPHRVQPAPRGPGKCAMPCHAMPG